MAPWDWVSEKASGIDIPSALGAVGEIPGAIGEKVGSVGSNVNIPAALGPIGRLPGNVGEAVGNVGSNINLPDWFNKPAAATGATANNPAGPTPVTGTQQPAFQPAYSPLAMNLFFSQAVAPMMRDLMKQNSDTNAAFAAMSNASPTAKYIPPQFQEFFKQHDAHLAQGAQMFQNQLYSVPAAAAVDQLMSQVNQAREQAVQAYVQAQVANNATSSQNTAASFLEGLKSSGVDTSKLEASLNPQK
jgi:hypothetical protein